MRLRWKRIARPPTHLHRAWGVQERCHGHAFKRNCKAYPDLLTDATTKCGLHMRYTGDYEAMMRTTRTIVRKLLCLKLGL